ncbi:MAG: hypothetical protein ABIS14_03220 [Sphingomonas sp.]
MLHVIVFNVLLAVTCGYGIWRGGAPERIVAVSLALAATLSAFALTSYTTSYVGIENGLFAIDLGLLVALVGVALKADRLWPLVLAAMQFDTTVVHLIKLVDTDLVRITYALMITVWAYPMQVILAIGTMRHRRRIRRSGADRPWSVPQPR